MSQALPSYGHATGRPEQPILDALLEKYGSRAVVWPIVLSRHDSTKAYLFERNQQNRLNAQGDIRPKSRSGISEYFLDYEASPRQAAPEHQVLSEFLRPEFANSYQYMLSGYNQGYSTVDLDYVWFDGTGFRGFELTTYWKDFSSEAEAKRLVSTMNRRPSWGGAKGAHGLRKIAEAAQDLGIQYAMVFANTTARVGSALKTNGKVLHFPLTLEAIASLARGQVPADSIYCDFQDFIAQL